MNSDRTTGKELLGAAWTSLQHDREMLIFPVIGSLVSLLAAAVFAFAISGMNGFGSLTDSSGTISLTSAGWGTYVFAGLSIWVSTFIAVYVNTAITAGAMKRMDGEDPTLGYCISKANSRLPQIIGWATFAAVIGMILRVISERPPLGQIVAAILGAGWAILTYFAIPILLAEGTNPFQTVVRSKDVLFKAFGKALRTNIRYGIWYLLFILIAGAAVVLTVLASALVSPILGIIVGVVTAFGLLFGILVFNVLSMYIRTALYRYATHQPVPGIPETTLQAAFITN